MIEHHLTGFKYGEVGGKITMTGKRSEGLKKLIYSRKEMNNCAEHYIEFRGGPGEEIIEKTKCLSCTRALDEGLISKSIFYSETKCYGAKEGMFADPNITDDWFCCYLPKK